MFKENRYYKIYESIVSHAKKRGLQKQVLNGYFESHHIMPRSLGGTDGPENRALLTAREHFICHKLLLRFTEGLAYEKMKHAFCFMAFTTNNGCLKREVSSRDYEKALVLARSLMYTPERNAKISAGHSRRREAGIKTIRSEATKAKHKATLAAKTDPMPNYHREAIREGLKGNTNGAGHVVTEAHKQIVSQRIQKPYIVEHPDGTIENVLNLGKWLALRGQTQYPARGRKLKRGRFAGFTFTVCT